MEQNGTWDNTTVLVSSDHWWRTEYWDIRQPIWSAADDAYRGEGKFHHIPFLLKLKGQKESLTYDAPFNTVVSHDLILDILRGKLSAPDQVPVWLDAHRSIGESPYQEYDDPQ
jgi:arylsulfatase A-like enzyme